MKLIRRHLSLLLTAVVVGALSPAGGASADDGDALLAPELAAVLADAAPTDRLAVVVYLEQRVDLRTLPDGSRPAHRRAVVEALRKTAERAQAPVLRRLAVAGSRGTVSAVRPLWVVDAVAMRAAPALIREVARRPDVSMVELDDTFAAPAPMVASVLTEPNLDQIRVPELWAVGSRGAGVVVAVVDTGVDGSHPDLADRWRGGANSWFDPYGEHLMPADVNGHGTWTTGIVVGGDAGGTAIGVAPDARWIAAKAFDDSGIATVSALHAIFQWLLDPDGDPASDDAPDVVNGSWAYATPSCNLTFEPDLAVLRSIGILPVFAAGNGGPTTASSYSPANNPSALAVGAVSGSDVILSFSSRGPSSCGGRARVFPDLVAPGRDVWTSDLFGFWTTASGTSIAAPHVAGVLALLLSGKPGLTADQQAAALTAGARDLGPAGPDDTYGAGRLDALAAWNAASFD